MRKPRLLCVVVASLAALVLNPVSADDKLPPSVVTSNAPLAPAQQAAVESYVRERAGSLVSGPQERVVTARQDLLKPLLQPGASRFFLRAYGSALAQQLSPALTSPDLLVRLNTMIVVASAKDPSVLDLIVTGLADPSPSVRYWAARSAGQLAAAVKLVQQDQDTLLATLLQAFEKENSDQVKQKLRAALIDLNIPEGIFRLLDSLSQEVDLYAADPTSNLDNTLESLRLLFVKTVEASSTGQPLPEKISRQMALVAYRYLVLSVSVADASAVDPNALTDYQEMIRLADAILGWVARRRPSQTPPAPPSIQAEIEKQDWPMIRLRTEEWKQLLQVAPFSFTTQDLAVPTPHRFSSLTSPDTSFAMQSVRVLDPWPSKT